MSLNSELNSVRIDELVVSLGRGIAQAQYELDQTGIQIARLMSGADDANRVQLGQRKYSMLELGLTPTFYQFVDTVIEIKVSISIASSSDQSVNTISGSASAGLDLSAGGVSARMSAVSAGFASKYQYSAEGSSLLRTKLVPVPAPALLNERIRKAADAGSGGGTP